MTNATKLSTLNDPLLMNQITDNFISD